MTHVLAQGGTFIDLPAVIAGPDGTTYPRSIVGTSDAAFLATIGVYELVPAVVPEGKVATSITRALVNGKVVETVELADAPAIELPERVYSWLEFVDLFTPTEQQQLTAAAIADPEGVGLWYFKAVGTQGIRMSDPRTSQGIDALYEAGLISEARRDQIIAGEAPTGV